MALRGEQVNLTGDQRMLESTRRFRFGLLSLLLLPLSISPLCLSTVFVREQFQQNQPGASYFFNTLACTVAYAAFFTARSLRRRHEKGQPGRRHVLPAMLTGAIFGVLFMVQIGVPWAVAIVITAAHRSNLSPGNFLSLDPSWILKTGAAMGAFVGLFGSFLGAFGGSIVGLVFDWRYAHPRPTRRTQPSAESPKKI
jgi:hypothetical protein